MLWPSWKNPPIVVILGGCCNGRAGHLLHSLPPEFKIVPLGWFKRCVDIGKVYFENMPLETLAVLQTLVPGGLLWSCHHVPRDN